MELYVFLILNYKTFNETRLCVNSIDALECEKNRKEIIIVDNCSADGSYEALKKEYNGREDIHVILHENNGGFSKGNNYGYQFIKENFSPNFIIMINSDIIIKQRDFLTKISKIYEKSNFSVLGPDVYAYKMNLHQSPIKKYIRDKKETEKELEQEKKRFFLYCEQEKKGQEFIRDTFKDTIVDVLVKYGRKFGLDRLNRKKLAYWKNHENVMIHGSAIIFSRPYIEKYQICLYPMPFYYGEEDLLYLKCVRNNDKIIYSPEIKVYHSAGASASNAKGKTKTIKREIFRYENLIATKELYLRALENELYFDVSLVMKDKD